MSTISLSSPGAYLCFGTAKSEKMIWWQTGQEPRKCSEPCRLSKTENCGQPMPMFRTAFLFRSVCTSMRHQVTHGCPVVALSNRVFLSNMRETRLLSKTRLKRKDFQEWFAGHSRRCVQPRRSQSY